MELELIEEMVRKMDIGMMKKVTGGGIEKGTQLSHRANLK